MRPASAILLWAPALATMAVVCITLSMSMPMFALLLERLGASGTEIGINQTIAAAALVLTAPVLPGLMARVGIVPLMLGSLVVLALAMAAIPLWPGQVWWGFLRVAWGFAGTALFFASEYWLVSNAPDAKRGRIIGVYVLVLSGSYMIGPLLLSILGLDSWLTFAVPTVIVAAAAIPVILGRHLAPAAARECEERPGPFRALRFFRTDPMVLWGVLLFGVIEFGAVGLVPVWSLRAGHSQETALMLVFWLAFGSMAFQLPVGWAADRFDRRKLLALAGATSVVAPVGAIVWADSVVVLSAVLFVWGGMAVAFYSLALTELGARYKAGTLAAANAAVMLAYGLGAVRGSGDLRRGNGRGAAARNAVDGGAGGGRLCGACGHAHRPCAAPIPLTDVPKPVVSGA